MICPTCRRSTTVDGAEFVHVRLGLDEPPEPLLCKCKSPTDTINGIVRRCVATDSVMRIIPNAYVGSMPKPNINTATIAAVSMMPHTEVELRLNTFMSVSMYRLMCSGMFGQVTRSSVTEEGASMWVKVNGGTSAKVRTRSNGERIIKVPISVQTVVPGIKFAISNEHMFRGTINRPEYKSYMNEVTCTCMIAGVKVRMIARVYNDEDTDMCRCEVEIMETINHTQLRMILNELVTVIGSTDMMRREIDDEIMNQARRSDHAVVDVPDISLYRGTHMLKADGVKVYVFCYEFGYVITSTDWNLTVISCTVAIGPTFMFEMTSTPDIMVAEMMMDGGLVYIDTLCTDGLVASPSREYVKRPVSRFEMPPMLVRMQWDEMPPKSVTVDTSMPNDGLVCVTSFRTLRMKPPTIDLRYRSGLLYMSTDSGEVEVADGDPNMVEDAIYEMHVHRSRLESMVTITDPVERTSKRMPNNADVIKRAFMSVSQSVNMSMVLFDITNMSFRMRTRVYEMAQNVASTSGKVIVIFGAGRFQEMREMRLTSYSYIAIDPEIDIEPLRRHMKRVRVTAYDMKTPMSTQVSMISNRPGNVLYCKCRSEDFINSTGADSVMSSMMIPAVFSFSISYHIGVVNRLSSSGVPVFGCGYIHDYMPKSGVGSGPVTMKLSRRRGEKPVVVSKFGKSTYTEPLLLSNSVSNLRPIRESMPDLWGNVDSSTHPIMSRAVIMY